MPLIVRSDWECRRFRSPFDGLFGAVVEADDDVLGVAWDTDPRHAEIRALGEATERFGLQQTPRSTIRASAAELGHRSIRLEDRATYSAAQIAEYPVLATFAWDEHTESTWIEMDSHAGPRYVPADVATSRFDGVDRIRPKPMSSVGTACGANWDDALERAFLEVIERHTVADLTYTSSPVSSIDPVVLGAADIVEILRGRAELRVGLVASDFGPWVAVACVSGVEVGLPQAAFGSSARWAAAEAVRSAALEAIHVFHLAWRLSHRGTPLEPYPTNINQRALWWAHQGRDYLGAWFDDDAGLSVNETERTRASAPLTTALELAGHEWAHVDLTPDWAQGVSVARVVVPSLLQLNITSLHFLAAPRFQASVDILRHRVSEQTVVPHPFV